jgi:hypothetical protein
MVNCAKKKNGSFLRQNSSDDSDFVSSIDLAQAPIKAKFF